MEYSTTSSFYVGVNRNGELTSDEEKSFVNTRDMLAPGSPERIQVVNAFFDRSFYLLDRVMARYNGRQSNIVLSDLAADFMDVHQKCCDKFKGNSSYFTYLFRATHNHFLNTISRVNKLSSRESSDEFDSLRNSLSLSDRMDPCNVLSQREWADSVNTTVDNALQELNPNQRKIFMMDLDGIPQIEIAKLLDVPLGTVRSRLHYAKKILQNNIDKGLLIK